jgi:general secretion pathway protein N
MRMRMWMLRLRAMVPWLAVTVISCVITLIVLLPAAWITPQVARATQGHVNLIEPAGSLWRGSAVLMLAAGSDSSAPTLLPGRIEWRTAFWPLLTGRLYMTLEQRDAMSGPLTLNATARTSTLSAGSLAVPAALLAGLGAPFNTLDLQGNVRLSWSEWRLLERRPFGQLTVMLSEMASRVSRVKPLGSYRVVFQAQGDTSTLDLSTLAGPLQLKGHGTIAGGTTQFQGEASAEPEQRDNLAGLLNLLGQPIGGGAVALRFVQ